MKSGDCTEGCKCSINLARGRRYLDAGTLQTFWMAKEGYREVVGVTSCGWM